MTEYYCPSEDELKQKLMEEDKKKCIELIRKSYTEMAKDKTYSKKDMIEGILIDINSVVLPKYDLLSKKKQDKIWNGFKKVLEEFL